MSRTPSTVRTTVLAALLATTGLLGTAQAVTPAAPSASPSTATSPTSPQGSAHHAERHGERHTDRFARMAERHQQRLDQLKTRLQLTPEQEPAWRAYVARTGPDSHGAAHGPQGDRADLARLTTPERIERMKAWHEQRQAAHQQRMDATLSFYQALTPAQRQTFDQATAPGVMRAGMKGHRHDMPPRGAEKSPKS